MALDTEWSSQLLPYEQIGRDTTEATRKLKWIREAGYDVRTHHTNQTIPEQYFRVCYPFTMPPSVNPTIFWKEGWSLVLQPLLAMRLLFRVLWQELRKDNSQF